MQGKLSDHLLFWSHGISANLYNLDLEAVINFIFSFFSMDRFDILSRSTVGNVSDCRYMCLTADPGVASLIPARTNTFVEIDHEIFSTAILFPFTDSRRDVVSYKGKNVHKVLVNGLVKLSQDKVWLPDYD